MAQDPNLGDQDYNNLFVGMEFEACLKYESNGLGGGISQFVFTTPQLLHKIERLVWQRFCDFAHTLLRVVPC